MTNYKKEIKPGYTIIHLDGEFIGGEETENLSKFLKEAAKSDTNRAILDLSGVAFLNSMALGVLLSANAIFHKQGGRVILANPSEYLQSIFKTTKLDLIFTIEESIDDAILSITK